MKEACDCSPEFCSVKDTTYHIHINRVCFHPDGTRHEIEDQAKSNLDSKMKI